MPKDTTYTNLGDYKGHMILINDDTLRFRVDFGPDDYASASSADGIKEEIDNRLKTEAKAIKLALPVLTSEGQVATITGLHMGTSEMLGTGLPKHGYKRDIVYPVVIWVADALAEQRQLQAQLNVLDQRLREVTIGLSRGYGHVDSAEYPYKIKEFVAEHAAILAKAEGGGR